jgi:triosephosphate isomerase
MNGNHAQNALLLGALRAGLRTASKALVGVCVPYPYLGQARDGLSDSAIFWAAQDVSDEESGAYTGQVSASMLSDFGCAMTLVGHSERRGFNGESNQLVARKAKRALSTRIRPIVCVGETLEEREAGHTEEVVLAQLQAVLEELAAAELDQLVRAYEPVWAIGTGRTATPGQAQEVHAMLRRQVAQKSLPAAEALTILYGGSVKPANAAELFRMTDIDGALVGGASLNADDFLAIVDAMEKG